jgi:hypothetical protein
MLGRLPDQYTIRARVLPALLVALPVGLAALAWFPAGLPGGSIIAGLLAWSGGTVLVAQLGRDAGRRKQPELFRSWGGPPTTKRLRHSGEGNRVTRERIHKKLTALMRKKVPSPDQEAADPRAADEAYEGCIEFLKGKTRDRKKFNLVFEENCNYGFRRNLWGLKPVGVALAVVALTATAVLPLVRNGAWTVATMQPALVPGAIIILILLGWVVVVTPRWVEVPANAYAERLLEATEHL